jgi:hypothetical protein
MDDDVKAVFDRRYCHWTGTFKQCYQDFLVHEITVFKKSTWNEGAADSSTSGVTVDGGEVWDYYPVGGTSSNCSNANDSSSSSSPPILQCRIASIPSPGSTDHAVPQVNTNLGLAHPSFIATSTSSGNIVDASTSRNLTSSGTEAPTSVDDDTPQQFTEEDAEVLSFPTNFETAKNRLYHVLISLLHGVCEEEKTLANNILFWLEQLQGKAIQQIQQYPKPPTPDSQCCTTSNTPFGFNKSLPNRRELVTQFHYLVQYWFPFVQVSTTDDNHYLTINTAFFDLIPYLRHPVEETLLPLYRLRFCTASNSSINNSSVVLTLEPETTTKDIRRWIHTKLSSTCRSMKTSTKTPNTIIVQRYAQPSTSKKRKRTNSLFSHSSTTPTSSKHQQLHLLCVIQKIGMEHLRCIQTLAQALSCSISDIGMAVRSLFFFLLAWFLSQKNVIKIFSFYIPFIFSFSFFSLYFYSSL